MYGSVLVESTESFAWWAPESFAALLPGGHLIVLVDQVNFEMPALEARVAGFEFRDSFAILSSGPRLKLAYLFRKPLAESTVARQLLATGTGAINIDACRVAGDMSEFFSKGGKPRSGLGHAKGYGMGEGFGGDFANPPHAGGRWPPNVLLVHSLECVLEGTRKVPGHKGYPNGPGGKSYQYSSDKRGHEVRPNAWAGHADADGMESVPAWTCDPRCSVRQLDQQSGTLKSGSGDKGNKVIGQRGVASTFSAGTFSHTYNADEGGASRFFPQFDSEQGAVAWLLQLVAVPGLKTLRLG